MSSCLFFSFSFCTWRFFIGANPLVFSSSALLLLRWCSQQAARARYALRAYVAILFFVVVVLYYNSLWASTTTVGVRIKVPTLVRPQTRHRGLCRLGRAVSFFHPRHTHTHTHTPGFCCCYSSTFLPHLPSSVWFFSFLYAIPGFFILLSNYWPRE